MKTQLFTKKRALISSVAMLLVAIIALGTATFAWFTKSSSATADQLSVKTVKASELQISKTLGEWGDQIHYGCVGKILKPASSIDGKNWYTANAAAKGSFEAASDDADLLSDLDGYVFKDQLNVRNNGGADVSDVKITFSLTETEANAGRYVRLALVPANKRGADAEPQKAFTESSAADKSWGVFASQADSAEAFKSADKQVDTVNAKAGGSVTLELGTLKGKADAVNSVKYYNLYVWFEGQDTDCKDANAGNEMPEVSFSVSGNTVETVA